MLRLYARVYFALTEKLHKFDTVNESGRINSNGVRVNKQMLIKNSDKMLNRVLDVACNLIAFSIQI